MAGYRGSQCSFDRFVVAHFADEDDVGILSLRPAQGFRERTCINVNFSLRYKRHLVAM